MLSIGDIMSHVPDDWDMIYFGGNHNITNDVIPGIVVNKHVVKINHTFAIHCVAIKNTVFDDIIKLTEKTDRQIDVMYTDIQKKYNVYCFYPSLVTQKIDFSDIQNRIVNYNYLIK